MKIALLGRTEFLLETGKRLEQRGIEIPLVVTAPSESHYRASEEDFAKFAKEIGAKFWVARKLDAGDVDRLVESGADVALSVNWPFVLGQAVIGAFPHGILNAHAGDLPRYRGNACPNWAILMGESHMGLCVHFMEPDRLDSGPILARDRYPLDNATYIGDCYEWLGYRIPTLFVEAIEAMAQGRSGEPQPREPHTTLRCYPRRPEDGRIDWKQPVESIHRLIRASSRPFPGAFSFLEGEERVTIWRSEVFQAREAFLAVPGQVLFRQENDPVVACGSGALRLTEAAIESGLTGEEAKQRIGVRLRSRLIS